MLLDQNGRPFQTPAPGDQREDLQLEALDVIRADRWENPLTGIGTELDKTMHGHFTPVRRLWDPEIVDLYNGSDLAAKGISKRAEEMFREGYALEGKDVDGSTVEEFLDWAEETYDLDDTMLEGMRWGGAFGGLLLILGFDDGKKPWEPLDESKIRDVTYINKVDRRFAYAQSYYSNLDEPKYGQPETYLISNGVATSAIGRRKPSDLKNQGFAIGLVHESRCIRFDGVLADVTTQQLLAGWSWSLLQRPYDVMRQFDHIFDSVGYLVSDASQAVFKLRGLMRAIGAGKKDELAQRLQVLEHYRSVMRAVAIDAGDGDGKNAESFERTTTSFAGLPDVMDRFMLRLCAAFDVPPMEMFGQGGGGLNSAGEAQAAQRKWYDSIRSRQKKQLAPKLRRAHHLLTFAKRSPFKGQKANDVRWKYKFHPLQSPTDQELAQTRYTNAQRDAIYVDMGAVKPEEVAVELGDVYPQMDVEAREEVLEAGKSFEPYPEDEPDGLAGMPGSVGQEPEGGGAVPPLAGAQLGLPYTEKRGNTVKAPVGAAKALQPKPGPAKTKKKDAHDPQRARGQRGRWSEEQATAASRHALAKTDVAGASGEGADHLQAAKAHAVAASAHRELAARHKGLGNKKASASHTKTAQAHEQRAAGHVAAVATGPVLEEPQEQRVASADAQDVEELPDDFGTEVPTQGSSCADCRFRRDLTCGNETFVAWASERLGLPVVDDSVRIPAKDDDVRRYCCSSWQAAPGILPKGDAGDWDETKHPRAPNGQFGEGGGGGRMGKALEATPTAEVLTKEEIPAEEIANEGRDPEAHALEHEAQALVGEALESGGFTYRPGMRAPTTGYIVSLPPGAGLNKVIDFKEMGRAATDREALRRELVGQVKEHLEKSMQHLIYNPTHYMGGYVEKDEKGSPVALHLDVNEHEPDREKAISAGRSRNQISIWDLGKSEEVKTGGTGR